MSGKGQWHGKQTGLHNRSHWETKEGASENASGFFWGIIVFIGLFLILKDLAN